MKIISELKKRYIKLLDYLNKHNALKTVCLFLLSLILAFPGGMLGQSGVMRSVDYLLNDSIYYYESEEESNILIIGVTTDDIIAFGSWDWDSEIMENIIDKLNAEESKRPAVIGIDIDTSSRVDNVVSLSMLDSAKNDNVVYGLSMHSESYIISGQENRDEDFTFEHIFASEHCHDDSYGFTNLFCDSDGVVRHTLCKGVCSEGFEIYGFAQSVYMKYLGQNSEESLSFKEKPDKNISQIAYSRKNGGFNYMNVGEFLEADISGMDFSGKIVLIGITDTSLTRSFISTIDHATLSSNVEIQANIVQSYIDGVEYNEVPLTYQLLLLTFLTTILVYVILTMSFRWVILLSCSYIVFDFFLVISLKGMGYTIYPLFIIVSTTFCFIVGLILNILRFREEQENTKILFKQYMDLGLVKDSLTMIGESTNENRKENIAVLFGDIRGFTSFTEKNGAEASVEILNDFLAMASDCIYENYGIVDKFIGDCVMAFFRDENTLSERNSSYNACKASLEMMEKSEILRDKFGKKYGIDFQIGIGISYGEVVLGNIGSSRRMDYTIIGDSVNVASRLEHIAPRGAVYVSGNVMRELQDMAFFTVADENIQVKGKSEPMHVYRLEAIKENV